MARTRPWKPTSIASHSKTLVLKGTVFDLTRYIYTMTNDDTEPGVCVNEGHQSPAPTSRYQAVESYLSEQTFGSLLPTQSGQPLQVTIEPPRTNEIGSQATDATTLAESDLDEELLRRLEEIREEFNTLELEDAREVETNVTPPAIQRLIEVDEPLPQPPFQAINLPPTPPTHPFNRMDDENEPVVRLTQPVYTSIMTQYSVLQNKNKELRDKNSTLQRRLEDLSEDKGDVSSTVGKLHYELEANKDYKAAMGRDIRQKDIELYEKDMEIVRLGSKVAESEMLQKQLERLNGELGYLRTSKTNEEIAHTRAIAQVTASKDKEITDLKAAVARSQTFISGHTTRAQNLIDTQALREKRIKQLQNELGEEQATCEQLRDEMEKVRESLPSLERLKTLQDQLHTRTSEFDRQKNEFKHLSRRYELLQEAMTKAQDETKSLKGAAHLIVPSVNTRLPKLVFPCMECFLKNVDCDDSSRCHNCTQGDEQCARWRCAMRHVTHSCNQVPCRFVHDRNGWLVMNGPRPQW
jgi:hypothetical protein